VAIENVEEDVFALVLLIDWSSRDLQVFEMEPLGPFHGKGRSKLAPGRIGDDLVKIADFSNRLRDFHLPLNCYAGGS
jgi:2-keto-4-pentenoate hydratase/2-oxohepta-3-ene-1,7-dioic acid hydratase in catechol pathway